jgi:hypothetical protein
MLELGHAASPILLAVEKNWREHLSTHQIWQGFAGAILTATIALITAIVGLIVGNSGAASNVLPGNPTQTVTVPGPTITEPGPTKTVPGPTVTVTTSPPEPTSPPGKVPIHLADSTERPDDLLTGEQMEDVEHLGIDGKRFDLGWSARLLFEQEPSILVNMNTNAEYSEFRGRVGLDSTSDPNRVRVQVLADGKTLYKGTVTLNHSHDVVLKNISNVVRLQIKVFVPEQPEMVFAVGDPKLYPR